MNVDSTAEEKKPLNFTSYVHLLFCDQESCLPVWLLDLQRSFFFILGS